MIKLSRSDAARGIHGSLRQNPRNKTTNSGCSEQVGGNMVTRWFQWIEKWTTERKDFHVFPSAQGRKREFATRMGQSDLSGVSGCGCGRVLTKDCGRQVRQTLNAIARNWCQSEGMWKTGALLNVAFKSAFRGPASSAPQCCKVRRSVSHQCMAPPPRKPANVRCKCWSPRRCRSVRNLLEWFDVLWGQIKECAHRERYRRSTQAVTWGQVMRTCCVRTWPINCPVLGSIMLMIPSTEWKTLCSRGSKNGSVSPV